MTCNHIIVTVAVVPVPTMTACAHTGTRIMLLVGTQATELCGNSAELHPAAATQHCLCVLSLPMLSCRELTYKDEEAQAVSEAKAAGGADTNSKASSGTQAATAAAGQVRHAAEALWQQ